MVSAGMKIYDSKGEEVIIDSIEDDSLYVTVITISYVTFNNGTSKMKQEIRSNKIYKIDDIGTLLFFDKQHNNGNPMSILKDSRYLFNKDNIINHFEKKQSSIMELIMSEAPSTPMSSLEKKKIIEKYTSTKDSGDEEREFYKKHYNIQNYFARIDFDTEYYIPRYKKYHKAHYYEKFYIGKNVKADYEQFNIIDWRSDIGSMFYDKEKTTFTRQYIGVYNSEIMLRRCYKFNPNTYQNIYIANNELYMEGSVDPFLLEVIEENRSNHAIGDIIKSIQSNQNKIIREAPRQNIIVQGCAGSGKTMILLHRLSYLKFNNYLSDLSRVKIITPNDLFTNFISDLSNTLEIKEIEHITMDKYYLYIARKYIKDYNIKELRRDIENLEMNLNSDNMDLYIHKGYFSPVFIKHLEELYNNKVMEYKNKIDSLRVLSIAKRLFGLSSIDKFRTNYELFDYLYKLCDSELFRKNDEFINKIEKLEEQKGIKSSYAKIIKKYNDNIISLTSLLERKIIEANNANTRNNTNKFSGIFKKSLSLLGLNSDKLSHDINDRIHLELTEILNTVSDYIRLPESKREDYSLLDAIGFRKNKKILDESFITIIDKIKNFSLNYIQDELKTLPIDIEEQYRILIKDCRNICDSKRKQITKMLEDYFSELEQVKLEINRLEGLLITEEETEIIDKCRLSMNERKDLISSLYLEAIRNQEINMKKKYNNSFNKYSLFILVNLLYFHYGPTITKEDFLFVDEAQDYSVEEYKLLNNLNGGQAVFNIYGDVNQSLLEERRIKSWKELVHILNGNYYELNENYRNTVQITEFCNTKFEYNHLPIGIKGPDVEHIGLTQIEGIINNILKNDDATRIAIIKKETSGLISYLGKYKELEGKSIIIGDVKRIKGLEFDTVFVFPNNMSKNELYISYTRSLRKLYIIK